MRKKINKINKTLARLTRKKEENKQIATNINESGDIITNSTDIKRIRRYYEKLYANKLENLG